jgi:hypothetical protein
MVDTSVIETLARLFKHKPHIQKGGEEVMFFCPKCNHYKRKLNVNTLSGYYHCWVCNFSGKSFKSLLNKIHASGEFYPILCKIKAPKRTDEHFEKRLELPPEFKPLYKQTNSVIQKHVLSYCFKRHLTAHDIIRYNIGYCEEGTFANRVIVPSYSDTGDLNFYCGRDVFNSKMKYRLCDSTKDIVGFEMITDFAQPLTLVEGVFDAFSVKYNAIPLFGKTLSNKLKLKLISNRPPRVNVLLDNDALSSSLEICKFLLENQIPTHLVLLNGKDPNDIGHEKTWQAIESSDRMDESKLFKLKVKYKL